ncbi:TPR Domain containing protein [Penicillium malachiteum]|uniref:TPR Domain containing protein n=1 Tax=Penicillium malachiteum TaxID=1324776 RepID=UPI002549831B|nr:TPR Domain containing protein [Penicillium malachiteum]KAJ5726428.1 TPR Domain containing protein [Penicillium malachiteum]
MDLQLVIQQHQEAFEATPKDHPEWGDRLQDLADRYHERYLESGAEQDLDLAIQAFQQLLEATPKDHPRWPGRLQNLGIVYCDRYERSGTEIDRDLSIQYFQEGVDATPHDDPNRADRLQNLGVLYFKISQRTGSDEDIDLAMDHFRMALEATPEDDPKWLIRLECLGGGYHESHQAEDDDADLELAIQIQQEQDKLDAISNDHPNWSNQLQTLGKRYHTRYLGSGVYKDIELAIQRYKEALDATPKDDSDWAIRLHALGSGYHDKYRRAGDKTDLELAIQQYQSALEVTPKDHWHPEQAGRFHSLGNAYHDRYLSTGAEADLVLAIDQCQKALEATPKNHPGWAGCLQDLGNGYRERYLRTGAESDLELAIQKYQDALLATPKDHPDWATRLQHLGNGYHDRYIRRGAETDLELAIQQYQDAVQATSKSPLLAQQPHLQNLGSGYLERYKRTGNGKDLELAIKTWLEVLEAEPGDHLDRAGQHQNIGSGYRERYLRTGSMMDLELAIQQAQAALNATPKDHPDQAGRLQNLGNGYHDRYIRTRAKTDLDLAIRQYQDALEATSKVEDHPDRAAHLQNLGYGYRERYHMQNKKAKPDLELAIQYFQEALEATPKDHPDRASQLQSLGTGYYDRYLAGDETDFSDLELAIQYFQEALEATPETHPERADRFQNLGNVYQERYSRTGSKTDLELATQAFTTGFDYPLSLTPVRIDISIKLISLQLIAGNWSSAYETSSAAMSLISQLTPRSLDISDKQHLLVQVSGEASDAAAIALMVGKPPYEALRLLELGRGVILDSINEMRIDMSDLQQEHPQLAEEFIQLRDQLNAPTPLVDQTGMQTAIAHHLNQRHNASEKLETTIQTIRSLPGFDRFLMAPSEEEIKAAASLGPIVIINISMNRCDALIVDKNELKSLPLPDLKYTDVQVRAADLRNMGTPDVRLLEWLWDMIAKPILDALGLTTAPVDHLPRIWWIPTGPLAQLPIHAAGYHFHGSNTVIDRVISSYSSSISALLQNRRRHVTPVKERGLQKAVLVGVGKTPGLKDLSFVPLEMERVEHLCSSLKLKVSKPQPYREDILSALNDCDLFHFAGHGESDPTDPSKSSLVLHSEPLVVSDLFETNLLDRMPFLAYLSACGTGQVKNDVLIDEALHLIAAYQIAGFRHVIGTLWEVNDRSCVEAATTLYNCLHERSMSDESVSEGLHRATMNLRELWISDSITRADNRKALQVSQDTRNASMMTKQGLSCETGMRDLRTAELYEHLPLNWVPYVHFGI